MIIFLKSTWTLNRVFICACRGKNTSCSIDGILVFANGLLCIANGMLCFKWFQLFWIILHWWFLDSELVFRYCTSATALGSFSVGSLRADVTLSQDAYILIMIINIWSKLIRVINSCRKLDGGLLCWQFGPRLWEADIKINTGQMLFWSLQIATSVRNRNS